MTTPCPFLDRASRVHHRLERFADACAEYLWIEGEPGQASPAELRDMRKFEGVPDVYPIAMKLIEEVGPGEGRAVGWLEDECDPGVRASTQDAAHHARRLILGEWGWGPGYSADQLLSLVAERRASGMPSIRRGMARTEAMLAEADPETIRAAELLAMDSYEIPETHRERVEGILAEVARGFSGYFRREWIAPGDHLRDQGRLLGIVRMFLAESLDDLDGAELTLMEAMGPPDDGNFWREWRANNETPLIGHAPASMTRHTLEALKAASARLGSALELARGQAERKSTRTESLADQMRKTNKKASAQIPLLGFMEGRRSATFGEIQDKVYPNSIIEPASIERNKCRVNEFLGKIGHPRRLLCSGGMVLWTEDE